MNKKLLIFLLGISVLTEANTQTIGVGAYYKNSVYHSKNQVNALPIINSKLITIILIFCFLVFIFSAYQIVLFIK